MNTRYQIINDNCLEALRAMPDCSVDSIVTDPPYGLGKDPDPILVMQAWLQNKEYQNTGKGFMNKEWDSFVPSPIIWEEALRVLKHGGHILCFAGTRTQDWMTMSLRFAGFEIRDCIMWIYGCGFPKALDVGKTISKASAADAELAEEWRGWKSALKPAYEPIILARKPLDGTIAENVLKHGVGALNIDGCRIGTDEIKINGFANKKNADNLFVRYHKDKSQYQGNVHIGRYPANLIHDGSDEVVEMFPEAGNGWKKNYGQDNYQGRQYKGGVFGGGYLGNSTYCDSGSAARFFYSAKASKKDRDEGLSQFDMLQYSHDGRGKQIENPYQRNNSMARNNHPTIKPTELMRYLCRLITPPNGIVLDPFCGSGSTGKGAILEGFAFIGIEREPHYAKIAEARCQFAFNHVASNNEGTEEMQQLDLFDEV